MSKNKKITPNAKMLTVILILLFVGSCVCLVIAGCNENFSIQKYPETTSPTEITTEVQTEAQTVVSTTANKETETTAKTEVLTTVAPETLADYNSDITVDSIYFAASAKDMDGNAVNLSDYFGSGFANYGGAITFSSGRFSVDMGISSGSSSSIGSYRVLSDTKMQLNFDNSDITVASINVVDGTLTSIELPMDDIIVLFEIVG